MICLCLSDFGSLRTQYTEEKSVVLLADRKFFFRRCSRATKSATKMVLKADAGRIFYFQYSHSSPVLILFPFPPLVYTSNISLRKSSLIHSAVFSLLTH